MEALGNLYLVPKRQDKTLPSMGDKIRRQIMVHMGPDPSYDHLWAFFSSYTSLSALCDEGGSTPSMALATSQGVSTPSTSRSEGDRAPRGPRHVPTIDDLEFVGMVDGSEDLIFDTLCLDSGLDPNERRERTPTIGRTKVARPS